MFLGKSSASKAETSDGSSWAERCGYWLTSPAQNRQPLRRRRQTHEPLILAGHGMSLRVNHGALVVRNGFTHHPQRTEERRFFRGDRTLPSRIIVLDGSGTLSFDALSWLSEQKVPLIRINWRGEVLAALGTGNATDPRLVAAQLDTQASRRGLQFAISLIRTKLRNSVETLLLALLPSPGREQAIRQLQAGMTELTKRPPKSVSGLLGLEGRAALAYFNAWQSLPLLWKGLIRHPIPRDWHNFGQRYTYARNKGGTRNASHPVNAILNYAYAVLESQVRIQVVAAGFDPTIGFLHSGRRGRSDFVLDLMEPMRPVVDRGVLEFVQTNTFHPADFTIRSDGVCRLNPELARSVALGIQSGISAMQSLDYVSTAFRSVGSIASAASYLMSACPLSTLP
jgi:CRISPR-associated endonuclease Cas1